MTPVITRMEKIPILLAAKISVSSRSPTKTTSSADKSTRDKAISRIILEGFPTIIGSFVRKTRKEFVMEPAPGIIVLSRGTVVSGFVNTICKSLLRDKSVRAFFSFL